MVKVGLIGLGGMGRVHYNCYGNNPNAQVVAICDVEERKRLGDWSRIGLNVDTSKSEVVDLSGIKLYADYRELLSDGEVQVVDICLPTSQHAEVAIAALRAGKNVLCEKPLARTDEQCDEVLAAWRKSGRKLMIGHCLHYWGEYVRAAEVIASGEYGRPLYASFYRAGGTPKWSWNNWLGTESESGGAVLDLHIHDVDAALWWFGKPASIKAAGYAVDDLTLSVDSTWTYPDGLLVQHHGSWDNNEAGFRFAFNVIMEHATLALGFMGGDGLRIYRSDQEPEEMPCDKTWAYQLEIDDMIDAISSDRPISRVTPDASALAVEVALEELRQIKYGVEV